MKLKHYLIASPENHYQPWITSKTAMACFIVAVWTLRLFMPGYIAVSAPGLDDEDLRQRINAERTNRFIPALATNSSPNSAATIKSNDMIDRSDFAHVDPDGDYIWPTIEAQGYKPYQTLGENLAIDFSTAESVVNAWMNSPGHRANVLNEKFQDQGMAAVYGEFEPGRSTYLITNLFGALLKRVASSNTVNPAPAPGPTPAPKPAPASPQPAPVPPPAPATETPIAQAPNENTTACCNSDEPKQPSDAASPVTSGERAGLVSLKVLIGIFAAIYTIFLAIDSLIIHRAKIRRENIPSSPHSLLLLLVSVVNFLTLWL